MIISNHTTQCLECGTTLAQSKKKFCSTKCKSKYHKCNCYKAQLIRSIERKEYFIQKAGGACIICGYHKNTAALSFHHRNPNDKSFPLDARHLSNRKLKHLEIEFNKCDLLCLNCHAELHNPIHSKPQVCCSNLLS